MSRYRPPTFYERARILHTWLGQLEFPALRQTLSESNWGFVFHEMIELKAEAERVKIDTSPWRKILKVATKFPLSDHRILEISGELWAKAAVVNAMLIERIAPRPRSRGPILRHGTTSSQRLPKRTLSARSVAKISSQIAADKRAAPLKPSVQNEKPLSRRQKDILTVLLGKNAIDSDSMIITENIAKKAEGLSANPLGYKRPVADLKRRGFVETYRGRGGGVWLTPAGKERAKLIPK